MYIALAVLIALTLLIYWILSLPVFGKHPDANRLKRLQKMANYKNGEVQNLSPTPMKPDEVSYWQMLNKFVAGNREGEPPEPIPHAKPDFSPADSLKITWFGHSSYFLQVDGKNLLVDPVFSERTSPFQFLGTKRFKGMDFITTADFPKIDVMIITHDHYDHLDYETILKLDAKVGHYIVPLGVGSHLTYWGIPEQRITELAWGESNSPLPHMTVIATPARHFSGRGLKRNQTLWSSFVLKTKTNTVFIGGDSGYDTHFKEIGDKYGPFDIAFLECGQYNVMWPLIHMFPEQVAQATLDLKASVLFPVHWAKYRLALHNWDEPIIRLMKKSDEVNISVATPLPGESFIFNEKPDFKRWWENL